MAESVCGKRAALHSCSGYLAGLRAERKGRQHPLSTCHMPAGPRRQIWKQEGPAGGLTEIPCLCSAAGPPRPSSSGYRMTTEDYKKL